MSKTRANLDAKRQLADMIDSEISSRMEDFLLSVGTGSNEQIKQQSEIITKNVTIEAKLAGYKQVQAEAQNIGSKYQIYVLLEYPIGQANQALVNQIKQNEVLGTQEAADEALAELEAEINKKKGS
jgi:thiamine pyrophosphate-dependent acetolactate synthase large subunit-like protein